MKSFTRFVILATAAMFLSTVTVMAEDFYMVKITSFMGENEYKVMTKPEYSDLIKRIRNENHQFSNAQKLAEKEWNKGTHTIRYPGRGLHQRKAMISKRYRTRNAAEAAVLKKEDLIQKSIEKKEYREAERQRRNRGRGGRNNQRDPRERTRQRREASRAKREQSLEEAKVVFEKHLNELLAPKDSSSSDESATEAENDAGKEKNTGNKNKGHN